jgi:hypothetical protein
MTLFQIGQQHFAACCDILIQHGVPYNKALTLRQNETFLPMYDRDTIAIDLPGALEPVDQGNHAARLQRMMLYALVGVADDAEFLPIYRLLIPWLVAHEIAHHVRDHLGLLSEDLWAEEIIATDFAAAITDYTVDERAVLQPFLAQAVQNLGANLALLGVSGDDNPAFYIHQQLKLIDQALGKPIPSVSEVVARYFVRQT